MTNRLHTALAATLTLGALGTGLVLAPSALAQGGGGGGVRASNICTTHGQVTLKAKADDGRIEVEAEVDVNRAGQTWRWSMYSDGVAVRRGSATTNAASGSFSVQRSLADQAGTHRISFAAAKAGSTQSCHVSLRA